MANCTFCYLVYKSIDIHHSPVTGRYSSHRYIEYSH